ncbi:MAG: SAM-dependent methyltransferase, partial [Fibrobacter sp.]|nr:SAM-dependent methyltransferase [Fibrobacter sp.]
LKNEGDIAIISDAGTPGIADPAFNLVRECVREGIDVRSVPGACAMINALVSSGLPTDRFRFENFSPKKSAQRLHLLEKLKETADSTLIFYASPHNLVKFIGEIQQVFGETPIALMRELTKKFEEHLVKTPAELLEHYKKCTPKGEYVLLFHPQGKGGLG